MITKNEIESQLTEAKEELAILGEGKKKERFKRRIRKIENVINFTKGKIHILQQFLKSYK